MIGAVAGNRHASRACRAALRLPLAASLALLCGVVAAKADEQVFAAAGCGPSDGPTGTVAAVIDPVSLRLEDGTVVRLAGVLPFEGSEGVADDALAFLEELTLGKPVRLRFGGVESDRYDRAVAQLFVSGTSEIWVQAELVGAGFAIVSGSKEDRACLADLLVHERDARSAGLGLWAEREPLDAWSERLRSDTPRYELVEGRVISIGRTERTIYLNFGNDWSVDFTVTIEAANADAIEAEGGPFDDLVGQDIRVRGWLREWNGPWIEVDHAEQIEVLDRSDGGA